jgi:predicted nucleic acid-binding protein
MEQGEATAPGQSREGRGANGPPIPSTAIVIDTTVVLAVVTNEPTKKQLIDATLGATLIAPSSLDLEVGNAFSRMFKRSRIDLEAAEAALRAYQQIPMTRVDIDLPSAVRLAYDLNVYAYDAYVIDCALKRDLPVISLDRGLLEACRQAKVEVIEVNE